MWMEFNRKKFKKNKTEFVPVDLGTFFNLVCTKEYQPKLIEKIYITASGGPFLNKPLSK